MLFGGATYAYITDQLPLVWAIALNTIAAYLSFRPTHYTSHHAVSNNRQLNDWIGRLAMALQSPVPFFRTFRYLQMQHYRFTNDKSKDPDVYVGTGPRWLLPPVFLQRPKSERRELVLAFFFGAAIFAAVTYAGWLEYYVLLFLLSGRITAPFLAIAFDFLPRYPHQTRAQDLPFRATSNRIGLEWLLTPLLLFQNYPLVHHLYQTGPFSLHAET